MADITTFMTDVLKGLGVPATPSNVSNMLAWQKAEGGWTNNSAVFNPLNTTHPMPGASSAGVGQSSIRRYPDYHTGVQATVATLRNGNYQGIIDALRNKAGMNLFAQAVYASPWGTKRGIAGVSAATASPASPTQQPGQITQAGLRGAGGQHIDVKSLNNLAKQFGFKSFSQAFGMDDGQLSALLKTQVKPVTTLVNGTPVINVTGKTPARLMQVLGHVNDYAGIKYKWGGKSPSTGFDCSGLIQYLYGKAGIKIPGYTIAQWSAGKAVPKGSLQPGDAVFFHWGVHPETHETGPLHVGLFLGNGMFLQAPKTGDVVKISSLKDRTDFVGGRRYT